MDDNIFSFEFCVGYFICDYLEVTPQEFFDEKISCPDQLKELCENAKSLSGEKLFLLNALVKYLI